MPHKKVVFLLLALLSLSAGTAQTLQAQTYANYLTINIANVPEDMSDDIYVLAQGFDPQTGLHSFLKFNENGVGQLVAANLDLQSQAYSYPLSTFTEPSLHIPQMYSGRLFISVKHPMDLAIKLNELGEIKIIDPDGFNPKDTNYYTLFDKIEFTYNEYGIYINPTAVDFFSLPLTIEQSGKKSGLAGNREEVLTRIHTVVKANDKTPAGESSPWDKLFLNFEDSKLRVVAPGKAQFIPGYPGNFDPNYLNSDSGFNYTDFLWSHYDRDLNPENKLKIDASELEALFPLNNHQFVGEVVNGRFVFSNETGDYSLSIDRPVDSTPFFGGAGDSFNAVNNEPKAIIVRNLTAAFTTGLLPNVDSEALNAKYFKDNQDRFYSLNPVLPEQALNTGPWYDIYAKALHSFGPEQPIYAFAYDDILGLDGTLHDPNADNPAPVTLTIGDLSDTHVPDHLTDPKLYTVQVLIGDGSTVLYNNTPLKHGQILEHVGMPMRVQLNGEEKALYFKIELALPNSDLGRSIVMDVNEQTQQAMVIFPAPIILNPASRR